MDAPPIPLASVSYNFSSERFRCLCAGEKTDNSTPHATSLAPPHSGDWGHVVELEI